MTNQRYVSVFDIIGPVMVGPSSSHTAGAVRLGRIARSVLGANPTEALVELHGSFAQTGEGHGTREAIVAGLLDFSTDDERIRHSLALAGSLGLAVRFAETDLGEEAHPNSVRLTLRGGGRLVQVTGASVGGGMVEITNIDGYAVRFGGDYPTLLVVAEDRPGTINMVTRLLHEANINVAFLRVERKQRGGEALMIVETDEPVPDRVVRAIEGLPLVRWVREVARIGE